MLGREVLLSKSSRALPNFSVSVGLISFALLGSFILSKVEEMKALCKTITLRPHTINAQK
jgi:hypothetical protein